MKTTHEFFVAIYDFGDPNTGVGTQFGTNIYTKLEELYAFEPEAIDYFVVTGNTHSQIQKSGAI